MDFPPRTPVARRENISQFSRVNTGKNLAASLKKLDDAISTTNLSSIVRSRKNLDTSIYTPNVLSPLGRTQDRSLFQSTRKNLSYEHSFDNIQSDLSKTVENWVDDDPGVKVTENLYEEFLQKYKNYPSNHQIFDLLNEYENLCSTEVNLLLKITKNSKMITKQLSRTNQVLSLLQNERNTWRLIHTLYKDRLQIENENDALMIDLLGKRLSEKQIIDHLYERDSSIRQYQLIVDWLERNAAIKLEGEQYEKAEYFAEYSVSWENTLSRLQQGNKNLNISFGSTLPIVTEMDPDAPIRQGKPLDDLDKEDEVRLLRHVLANVRAGQLDEAQHLCIKFGQPWRAASLEGWRLHHDPNYDTPSGGNKLANVAGNGTRDIWKSVCWKMAQDERIHYIERALYAALSGNIRVLLPHCTSWEDYLWAYFRTMVDVRVEREIRAQSNRDDAFAPLPASYWDRTLSCEALFQEINACQNLNIKAESKQEYRIIQKFIILDNIDGLIEEVYEWVKNDSSLPNHLLRFLAHLILFFRSIGRVSKEELSNVILEAYVKNLIETHRVKLVASYTATLPQMLQVEWYAKFLDGVSDRSDRQLCLQLAEDVGLDVPVITKLVVENVRNRQNDVATISRSSSQKSTSIFESVALDLKTETTAEDAHKIDAIDWLVFDPMQRAEALRQANAIMRVFLASRKIDAARAVFAKIPSDSLSIIAHSWKIQTGSNELSAEDDNACREYLCINAYLQALDSFADWFAHFHHAKPEISQPAPGASFTERVTFEHLEKQYKVDLERWQHALNLQTKMTVDRLYNVLLFVDGGWMTDRRFDAPVDEPRAVQMSRLRQLCLPQITLLLHAVLHETGQYRSCLQLADIFASDEYKLYEVFSAEDLREFLDKLSESSLVLLDKNLDPLGYNIQ